MEGWWWVSLCVCMYVCACTGEWVRVWVSDVSVVCALTHSLTHSGWVRVSESEWGWVRVSEGEWGWVRVSEGEWGWVRVSESEWEWVSEWVSECTHHTHITHSHSHSLTCTCTYIHTHTNSPTITPPSLLYFLFPSCFSMLSLSLEKLVTCGVIRSYIFFVQKIEPATRRWASNEALSQLRGTEPATREWWICTVRDSRDRWILNGKKKREKIEPATCPWASSSARYAVIIPANTYYLFVS